MDDYGGRPHWGKLHYQTASTLRSTGTPSGITFQAARAPPRPRAAPSANDYLDRVLGPDRLIEPRSGGNSDLTVLTCRT